MTVQVAAKDPKSPKKASELAAVIAGIKKAKGTGVVYQGSTIPPVRRIPTGVFEFDLATGGGFPKGRLSIVYGPESSGKSNICYCAAREAQRGPEECNKVVWIDLEGTFDPKWVAQFGVDLDNLVVVKPGYGEEAADLIHGLMQADDVALVVVDSVAMMTAAKEVEQSLEKFDVGTSSLLIKRLCNKMAISMAIEGRRDHQPAIIFINQTRFKIGVMFGDPETFPGGNAQRFLSSLTIRTYGKNEIVKEIHPDLPVFKDTSVIIKKAKVPVSQVKFEYKMTMYAHGDLQVGATASWNTVSTHLKAHGIIAPCKNGWVYGQGPEPVFPTLAAMAKHYYSTPLFRLELQAAVFQTLKDKAFFVDPKEIEKPEESD